LTSPSKTWKDEAIAFVLLALALVLFMRAWSFFVASQKETKPRLQSYTPRERVHEETALEQRARDLDYDPPMGLGYMVMGTAVSAGRGGLIIYQSNGRDGASRVYYR